MELPKKAAINIHGSLLEKYRGAAPIQYSLLNNDKETGVSLIYMTNKMDAGDIIFQEKFEIEENDTALEIYEKMLRLLENNLAL
ncbi:methionyl-tRNA formyltransferase [Chlamydia abortus]|nr:methionyl-tRNA formyltransferase [Chlamydia abortus]SGA33592.1 methionyl-tRNA formyltransferase [Chlamydia abortus]